MSFTRAIFQKSVIFLALVPLFAVWGFWMTYFKRPPETLSIYDHLHGVAMFAWLLLLVLQSYLVRTDRRPIHRQTGKLAWLLGPWIIVTTVILANYRLNVRGLTGEGLYILGLQIFILIQYTVFLAMALKHRKTPAVHARWMICTVFTMLDPIFARVLLVNFIHVPIETGMAQFITYGCIDLLVLGLAVRDWKREQRKDVFLPALIVLVVTQIPTLVSLHVPAWRAFAEWFMRLPLS